MAVYKNKPRNLVMNGNFVARERSATSGQTIADGVPTYVHDRWRMTSVNVVAGHNIDSQGEVVDGITHSFLYMQAVYTNVNNKITAEQRIESIYTKNLRKNLSYGFYVKSGSATQVRVVINCPTAENNWSSTTTYVNQTYAIPANNSLQFISLANIALPALYQNGISIRIEFENMSVLASAIHLLGLVMFCESRVVQSFNYFAQDELNERTMMKRYFEKSYNFGVQPGNVSANGIIPFQYNGTSFDVSVRFQVPKRVNPSVTIYSPATGASGVIRNDSTSADQAATVGSEGESGFRIFNAVSGSAGNRCRVHYAAECEL